METEIATTTAAGSSGSLTSFGSAAKALALAHPMTTAVVGGALLGIGTYYVISRSFKKRAVKRQQAVAAAA